MPNLVTNGAILQCMLGTTPSTLVVAPEKQVNLIQQPAATIMDHVPLKNIMTFGMCTTLSNPVVAAATAAKLGVYTPAPCIPATATPWTPASPIQVRGLPALLDNCTCQCMWGGTVSVINPGQVIVSGD